MARPYPEILPESNRNREIKLESSWWDVFNRDGALGVKRPESSLLPKLTIEGAEVQDLLPGGAERTIKCGAKTWQVTYDKEAGKADAKPIKVVTPDNVTWKVDDRTGAWTGTDADGKVVATAKDFKVTGAGKDISFEFVGLQKAGADVVGNTTFKADGSRVERFGQNAIFWGPDATNPTKMYYQGKWLDFDKDGNYKVLQNSVLKFNRDDGTVVLQQRDNPDVHMVIDAAHDTTTVFRKDKSTRVEVTSNYVKHIEKDQPTKIVARDGSYSIDLQTGRVAGKNGEPLPPNHPLKDLQGKPPKIESDGGLTVNVGADKTKTFYVGSHIVLKDKDGAVKEVQYGKQTWTISKDKDGTTTIQGSDDTKRKMPPHVVPPTETVKVSPDGSIFIKHAGGSTVEIDPRARSEKITKGDEATINYAERPGGQAYQVTMSRDAEGNWGVTGLVNSSIDRWRFEYKPVGSRDAAALVEVSGRMEGDLTKGKGHVKGLSVAENGEVSIQYDDKNEYKSAILKPASLEASYTTQDGRKISVKSELAGAGVAHWERPVEVSDGTDTCRVVRDGDKIQKLVNKDGKTIFEVGRDKVTEIHYDSATKGFEVRTADGRTIEIDPTRRSQRVMVKNKEGKEEAVETFRDKHKVASDRKPGELPVVRFITNTDGCAFQVIYDEGGPRPQIKGIVDGRGVPVVERVNGKDLKLSGVTPEGVLTFDNAAPGGAATIKLEKRPDGGLKLVTPDREFVKDKSGRMETTLPRVAGAAERGFVIEPGPVVSGASGFQSVQRLTLKSTGETITYNQLTHDYEHRSKEGAVLHTFKGNVKTDGEGTIFVNGQKLLPDAKWDDIEAASKVPNTVPRDLAFRRPGAIGNPFAFADPVAAAIAQRICIQNQLRFVAIQGRNPLLDVDPIPGAILPNGVRQFQDRTTITVTDVPAPGVGTVTKTVDGLTGRTFEYKKDGTGGVVQITYPDGNVWTKKAGAAPGAPETWVSKTGQTATAITQGPGCGLDQYGFFHFRLINVTDRRGVVQPINASLVCAPDLSTLNELQYLCLQRTGHV